MRALVPKLPLKLKLKIKIKIKAKINISINTPSPSPAETLPTIPHDPDTIYPPPDRGQSVAAALHVIFLQVHFVHRTGDAARSPFLLL